MNIITERTLLEDKNGNQFQGPDPKAIFGGSIEVKVNDMGISIVPNLEKDKEGRYRVDDLARLEALFPRKDMGGEGLARGRWIDPVHFEILRGARDETGKPQKQIVFYLRTQSPGDREKIHNSCPHDQTAMYKCGWKGNRLEFLNAVDKDNRPTEEQQEHARVSSLFDPDLETEAAVFGVDWDTEASRETMVDRVVLASMEKKRLQQTQAAAEFGEAEKEATQSRSNARKRNTPAVSGAGMNDE